MDKRYLNITELSEYIGVPVGTLRVWTCLRKLPHTHVGRLVRYDRKKIDQWLDDSSIEALG